MANDTVGLVRQVAKQKLGELGASARSATDSLMDAIRFREPRVAGVDKNGKPLYENPMGFGPPLDEQGYQMLQNFLGAGPSGGMMGGLVRALPKRPSGPGGLQPVPSGPSPPRPSLPGNPQPRPSGPVGRGLPRPTAEVLPPDPSVFNRPPGRIVDPVPRSPEILPPGNNPWARPGRVVDPVPRAGTGLATTGGAPSQGGPLGLPAPSPQPYKLDPSMLRTGTDRVSEMLAQQTRAGAKSGMPTQPQAPTGDPYANFGNQFKGIDYAKGIGELAKGYGRQAAKGLGATALVGSGLAAGAGALSARDPQMPQAEPPPQSAGNGFPQWALDSQYDRSFMFDENAGMAPMMAGTRGLGEPQLPPEPLRVSGRNKRRGVPVQGSQTATGAIQQAVQQPAQEQMQAAGNQSGGSGPGYWIDMLQAADTGDAYARDLVALREQARASAIAAAQRGDSQQFVPIMDYRGNKMHFVNAGGGDVVLDMNDEQDRNQYQRIIAKTGLPAEQVQQWASRTSSPLMGYFERGGGPRRPEFDRTPKPAMPQQ